jgi:hypothetical protein
VPERVAQMYDQCVEVVGEAVAGRLLAAMLEF